MESFCFVHIPLIVVKFLDGHRFFQFYFCNSSELNWLYSIFIYMIEGLILSFEMTTFTILLYLLYHGYINYIIYSLAILTILYVLVSLNRDSNNLSPAPFLLTFSHKYTYKKLTKFWPTVSISIFTCHDVLYLEPTIALISL